MGNPLHFTPAGDFVVSEKKKFKRWLMTDLKGELAIPFKRCDSNGRTILLDSYKGNWLLMVFHRHLG